MHLNDRQYELVARYLDGEEVELSPQELLAAERIRRQEAQLGALLDVRVPQQTMARARMRMMAELAHPRHRALRIGVFLSAAAAVAAVLLVAVVSFHLTPQPAAPDGPPIAGVGTGQDFRWAQQWARNLQPGPDETAVEVIATAIAQLQADLVMSEPASSFDLQIDAVEQSIEDFWSEDACSKSIEI